MTALLSFIQSKKYTSLKEIEEKFKVSERTVFRDLKALEEAEVPLGFEKEKGYFIANRYFLPPLAFTLEEAKSFIFVEQLAKKFTDKETYKNFNSALEKIKNKLRDQQLEDIEKLASSVGAYIDEKYLPKHLATVEEACTKKQVLKLNYCDAKGNKTDRMVEPIGMTFYYHSWHLIGYCRLRNDYRDFSLSRVIKLKTTQEQFTQEHISLSDYIKKLENS